MDTLAFPDIEDMRPPIFIAAYPTDGKRRECLLEPDERAPDWFKGKLHLVVRCPSGRGAESEIDSATPEKAYETCLGIVRPERHWRPDTSVRGKVGKSRTEIWSKRPVQIQAEDGWLRVNPLDPGPASDSDQEFIVLRQSTGRLLHTCLTSRAWFETEYLGNVAQLLPFAMVSFDLGGALWGFHSQSHHIAGEMVTKRMMRRLVAKRKIEPLSPVEMLLVVHSALAYRDIYNAFPTEVREIVDAGDPGNIDVAIAQAVFSLRKAWDYNGQNKAIVDTIRALLARLATTKPWYGYSVEWIASNLSTIRHDVLGSEDRTADDDLKKISAWLVKSYCGKHMAIYEGLPQCDRSEFIVTTVDPAIIETVLKGNRE